MWEWLFFFFYYSSSFFCLNIILLHLKKNCPPPNFFFKKKKKTPYKTLKLTCFHVLTVSQFTTIFVTILTFILTQLQLTLDICIIKKKFDISICIIFDLTSDLIMHISSIDCINMADFAWLAEAMLVEFLAFSQISRPSWNGLVDFLIHVNREGEYQMFARSWLMFKNCL